jgi:hypothetical protein
MSYTQILVILPDDNFSLHKVYTDPKESKQGLNRWENHALSSGAMWYPITQTVRLL